jgi:hypothetical protein
MKLLLEILKDNIARGDESYDLFAIDTFHFIENTSEEHYQKLIYELASLSNVSDYIKYSLVTVQVSKKKIKFKIGDHVLRSIEIHPYHYISFKELAEQEGLSISALVRLFILRTIIYRGIK